MHDVDFLLKLLFFVVVIIIHTVFKEQGKYFTQLVLIETSS